MNDHPQGATANGSDKDKPKEVTIIVNGRPKTVTKDEMTFDEIVTLADGLPTGPMVEYTITFRRGHGNKPEGSLVAGDSVRVKDGMIFNVSATDKS
jgi:hypothetical protein